MIKRMMQDWRRDGLSEFEIRRKIMRSDSLMKQYAVEMNVSIDSFIFNWRRIDKAISQFYGGDAQTRYNSLRELAVFKDPITIPFIIEELAKETDPEIRLSFLNVMNSMRHPAFFPVLEAGSRDPNAEFRYDVIDALIRNYDKRSLDVLFSMAREDEDIGNRSHAIEGIGILYQMPKTPYTYVLGEPIEGISSLLSFLYEDDFLAEGALIALTEIANRSDVSQQRRLLHLIGEDLIYYSRNFTGLNSLGDVEYPEQVLDLFEILDPDQTWWNNYFEEEDLDLLEE